MDARQHGRQRLIMHHESCAPPVQEDFGGDIRSRPSSCLAGDLASLGVHRQGPKELGAGPAGERVVEVSCEGVQERTGQIVGQVIRVERAITEFGRVPPSAPQRGQQGNSSVPERLGFHRRQVAHLHVVAEHGPVQPDEFHREQNDVLMLGGVGCVELLLRLLFLELLPEVRRHLAGLLAWVPLLPT